MSEKIIEEVFKNEVKLVRAVCHNYFKVPLYGKELQDVVILHLENFKRNLIDAFKRR